MKVNCVLLASRKRLCTDNFDEFPYVAFYPDRDDKDYIDKQRN